MHGSTRQALRVDAMTVTICPHCGARSKSDDHQQYLDGRDFLVVFWKQRGFTNEQIGKALGVGTNTIQKKWEKLRFLWEEQCGFHKISRQGKKPIIVEWFDSDGIHWALGWDWERNKYATSHSECRRDGYHSKHPQVRVFAPFYLP